MDEGLAAIGAELAASQIERLAGDFALGPGEIADIVSSAQRLSPGAADYDGLRRACVARLQGRLGRLADLVVTHFRWDDLVLPDEEIDRLWEIVIYQQYRQQVFSGWNLVSKLPYGGGIAALFSGPPGTGKTMAASVIANALGRELHRVDLSRVVDKYIGETEKNLAGVFDAAAAAGAVLLFDEADALFAKRTTVSSSNDRYANLETNFLLQRIEAHAGITLLTTNNPRSIDEAFLRRIQFKVEFPFPDAAMRARLWTESLPAELPLAADVRPDALGADFELSGGHIRAAVLRAAYRAAALGQPVSQQLLADAALIELEGLGKLVPAQGSQRKPR
jgi:SpoVK/Ycf46/Vps4 family AAA+-type ATPase